VRLRHGDGTTVHLAYCTNVHPAEDVEGVLAQLRQFAEPVRARLDVDRLGIGLWLAGTAAATLAADPRAVDRLRRELHRRGLEVVTLNGFPYRGFHAATVKHAVYHPDWTRPERLDYTLDLARVLAALLPDDAVHGSISTVPLGWRHPWPTTADRAALDQLDRLAEGLDALAARTGRPVRVGLEAEPGCVVESSEQAVDRLAGVDRRWLGLCLDACHLAVGFEDPVTALSRFAHSGLPVVKLQASAALHADRPTEPTTRRALASFSEERFLHQVRERTPDGLRSWDDLPRALDDAVGSDPVGPWRVHFHVPLHAVPRPPLRSTRTELSHTLEAVFGGPAAVTDHVEVETYTWGVLPVEARPVDDAGLVNGIAAELDWARDRLLATGLREAG
jgi:sugar phosphate isomerase/epimerase